MATTAWHTLTRFDPRQWLLADGQVITEPVLEQTASGRKVRIQGTVDSVFYGELDTLLATHAHDQAHALGTEVLSEVTNYDSTIETAMGFKPSVDEARAKLHLLHDTSNTTAWWRFDLPSTPFHVYLVARIDRAVQWNRPAGVAITVTLWMPRVQLPHEVSPLSFDAHADKGFASFQEGTRMSDQGLSNYFKWQEFFARNQPNWDTELLQNWNAYDNPRVAVRKFLKIVRSFEQEDHLQIPNASTLSKPSWLTLKLSDTNVNSEFINDMTEYLDTDAAAKRILDLYSQLREELRHLGVTTDEKTLDTFAAAIMSGEKGKFSMEVTNPVAVDSDWSYDHEHTLSVHLPTGTFIVECDHREPRNDILERWEEAKTIAALGGEEDELLAFARAVAKKKHRKRTKAIIEARKGAD